MIKNVSLSYTKISSSLELSSDHTPVIAVINSSVIGNRPNRQIHNQLTNWHEFSEAFNASLLTPLPLRRENDIDAAVDCFSNNIINTIRFFSPNQESIRNQPYLKSTLHKERNLRKNINSEEYGTLVDYLKTSVGSVKIKR